MLQYKQYISLYFSIVFFSILFLCIGFYTYDPLQIFHKPWGREITFNKNMRLQDAGITNNYNFDSIILGTSMLENTSSLEAKKKLHGNFVNLSLSGSTFYERLLIMRYILKNKPIKKIIYSLDAGSYIHQQKAYGGYPLETFDYLYDNNVYNDFRAYFNTKFLTCLVTLSQKPECIGENVTLNRPNAWYNEEGNKVRYGGLDNWFKVNNNKKIRDALNDIVFNTKQIELGKKISLININNKINKAKHYIDETVLSLVKQYPKTEFIMIFPPYSRMHYAWWAQYYLPYFEIHKAIIQYLTEQSSSLHNLKLYGFEDQSFLDNLSNYKDAKHYHYSINSWMLSQISKGKHQLKKEMLNHYLHIITEKAVNYDIISIGKRISAYLNQSPKDKININHIQKNVK